MAKRQPGTGMAPTGSDQPEAAISTPAQAGIETTHSGQNQPEVGMGAVGSGEGDRPQDSAADPLPKAPLVPAAPPQPGDQGGLDDEAEDNGLPKERHLVPMNSGQTEASERAKSLLFDACRRFDIDPTIPVDEGEDQELGGWNYYPADRMKRIPDSVVLVTMGGVKLRHYGKPDYLAPNCTCYAVDQDTEDTLARLFSAFSRDPRTKEIVRLPLPEDLALPPTAKTGKTTSTEHRYRRGYLREGGKQEADRRDAKTRERTKR